MTTAPPASVAGRAWPLAVAALLGVAAALVVHPMLARVGYFGRWIPSPDLAPDYIKGVLWALVLGATIPFWPVRRADRAALGALWAVKCAVTLGFMLVYESQYVTLDAYAYFEAAQAPYREWRSALLPGNGTYLMEVLAWLHGRVLMLSYHAMKVTSSMIGLVAVYLFYRAACIVIERRPILLLFGLMLVPSILFWTSILGKDPLILLGIALFSLGVTQWLHERRAHGLAVAALGLVLVVYVRSWIAPVLVLPLAFVMVVAIRSPRRRLVVGSMAVVALAVAGFALRDYFAASIVREMLETLGTQSQAFSAGGSARSLDVDFTNPAQVLRFLPIGVFTALFRPLPGEVMNAFGLLAGLENLALVGLLVVAMWRARLADLREPVVLWALLFILAWGVLYAPISYANSGTAVRFRLQVMPALLLVLAYLARPRRSDPVPG